MTVEGVQAQFGSGSCGFPAVPFNASTITVRRGDVRCTQRQRIPRDGLVPKLNVAGSNPFSRSMPFIGSA